jgi:hypothetical protein
MNAHAQARWGTGTSCSAADSAHPPSSAQRTQRSRVEAERPGRLRDGRRYLSHPGIVARLADV